MDRVALLVQMLVCSGCNGMSYLLLGVIAVYENHSHSNVLARPGCIISDMPNDLLGLVMSDEEVSIPAMNGIVLVYLSKILWLWTMRIMERLAGRSHVIPGRSLNARDKFDILKKFQIGLHFFLLLLDGFMVKFMRIVLVHPLVHKVLYFISFMNFIHVSTVIVIC